MRTLLARAAIGVWLLSVSFGQTLAQTTDLAAALSGKTHPLTRKLSEFDNTWRRVKVHGTMNVSGNTSINLAGTSANSVSQNNNLIGATGSGRAYITRGALLDCGGRTFVVAYHLPSSSMDLGMLLQVAATKSLPTLNTLKPDTEIPLSLLDISQVGAFEDVREFDIRQEISESETAAKALEALLKAEAAKQSQSQPSKPQKSTNAVTGATEPAAKPSPTKEQ